ncbi:hypothetical protein HPB50_000921 [Hyalomma asiaticum]|uniref:Uncharacterized protein n=1 Tax=Hyalomma asiaticum TaxID=266040 RepID=A0ACB7SDQ7_HYAAI|nr:hypothetical protein HPB50_000921 [Hyalomma asiaticum]
MTKPYAMKAHRSKSLTQIDCLEGGMSRRDDEPSGGSSPSDASGQPQSLQSQPSQSSPSHQPPPSPDRLSVPEDAPPQRSRLRHSSRLKKGVAGSFQERDHRDTFKSCPKHKVDDAFLRRAVDAFGVA